MFRLMDRIAIEIINKSNENLPAKSNDDDSLMYTNEFNADDSLMKFNSESLAKSNADDSLMEVLSLESIIEQSVKKNTENLVDSLIHDDSLMNNDLTGGANLKDMLKDVLTGGGKTTVTNDEEKSIMSDEDISENTDEDTDEDTSDSDSESVDDDIKSKYTKFLEDMKDTTPIVFKGGSKETSKTCKVINSFPYVLRSK